MPQPWPYLRSGRRAPHQKVPSVSANQGTRWAQVPLLFSLSCLVWKAIALVSPTICAALAMGSVLDLPLFLFFTKVISTGRCLGGLAGNFANFAHRQEGPVTRRSS